MAIFVGGEEITANQLFVAGQAVQEVYVGSQLVFQNAPPTASVVSIQTVNAQTGNVTVADQGAGTLFVAISLRVADNPTAATWITTLGGVTGNTQDIGEQFRNVASPFRSVRVIVTTWRAGTVSDGTQSLVATPNTSTGNVGTIQKFFTISGADQTNGGVPIEDGKAFVVDHSVTMSAAANTLCVGCAGMNDQFLMDAPSGLTAGLVASDGSVLNTFAHSYAMTMASTASLDQTLDCILETSNGTPNISVFSMLAIPGV